MYRNLRNYTWAALIIKDINVLITPSAYDSFLGATYSIVAVNNFAVLAFSLQTLYITLLFMPICNFPKAEFQE